MSKVKEAISWCVDLLRDIAIEVKNEFLTAACQAGFGESVAAIIGVLVKYVAIISVCLFGGFVAFIAVVLLACLICEFPLTSGAIGLGLILFLLLLKLVRIKHKNLVKQAKEDKQREIDRIVEKWKNEYRAASRQKD